MSHQSCFLLVKVSECLFPQEVAELEDRSLCKTLKSQTTNMAAAQILITSDENIFIKNLQKTQITLFT